MQEPLASIPLPGVHAYAEKCVVAGTDIHFRISGYFPNSDGTTSGPGYQLSILRPGLDLYDYSRQTYNSLVDPVSISGIPPIQGTFESQGVTPGSFVLVENALPQGPLNALTLECWVRPFQFVTSTPEVTWGLVSQYSYPDLCGFGLFLTSWGTVALYFGDGLAFDGGRLFRWEGVLTEQFTWAHVVGVWDGANVSLYINGQRQKTSYSVSGPVNPGTAPLRLAAYGENGKTAHFLDGALAMPTIYGRALSKEEIQQRYKDKALSPPSSTDVLACWPLDEENGQTIKDISQGNRTGTIINRGTWMIGGPSFKADAVPRFGEYDPSKDPTRGHALRFASDDLYDAGWTITHTISLPPELAPGIYIGRIEWTESGTRVQTYDVTFVVKKPQTQPKARMAVLCATNTWLAYNCTPFVPNYTGTAPPIWGNDGRYDEGADGPTPPPGFTPAYNYYHDHLYGQPTYLLGMNLPWPGASPEVRYFGKEHDYSHLVRAELFTHYWLDKNGYDYDVITDFDLSKDPDALTGYKVLLIAGHSEYWTSQAYQALDGFLKAGNDVIVLSGNTMFWRVSFDPDFEVMQCRKAKYLPGGRYDAGTGETWHSGDGKKGGLMRECGYPAWRVLGMECVGFWNEQRMGDYICEAQDHELFHSPNETGLKNGDRIAEAAVGHEWDIRVSQYQQSSVSYTGVRRSDVGPGQPGSTAFQPDLPDRIQALGYSLAFWDSSDLSATGQLSNTVWDYFIREADPTNGTNSKKLYESLRNSEIIYWERTQGGRVFYAGSNATGQALWGGDNNTVWQNLLRNVLAKFEVANEKKLRDVEGHLARLSSAG